MSQYNNDLKKLSFGEKGFVILAAGETSVASELYSTIMALDDAVISFSARNSGTVTNLTLTQGLTVYGGIYDITVTSGQLIAYRR